MQMSAVAVKNLLRAYDVMLEFPIGTEERRMAHLLLEDYWKKSPLLIQAGATVILWVRVAKTVARLTKRRLLG